MSLQLLAKQMEAKGRGGDSMLVHMTPGEVAGLQKLAESAGGSLTVNPETGLVEAFTLKELFPVLAGAAITAATGGAAAPWMVGLGVGGFEAMRTGDINKGLMAGLGAYGGAGLTGSVLSAGSQAAQAGAMQTAANQQAAQAATQRATQEAAMAEGAKLSGAEAAQTSAAQLAKEQAAQQAAQEAARQEASAQAIEQARTQALEKYAAQGVGDKMGQGISALMDQGSNVGRDAFMSEIGGGKGLARSAAMAAAPMLVTEPEKQAAAPEDDEMYYYEYNPGRTYAERNPSASSKEELYLNPSYSERRKIRAKDYPLYAAQGGLMSLAEGGEAVAATAEAAPESTMTGASKAAYDYLMGRTPTVSYEGLGAKKGTVGTTAKFSGDSQMYMYDPATGQYIRNPNYEDPEVKAARLKREADARAAAAARASRGGDSAMGTDGFGNPVASDPAWEALTPDQKWEANKQMFNDFVYDYNLYSSPTDTEISAAAESDRAANEAAAATGEYGSSRDFGGGDWARGGLVGLAKGGLASGGFVVPADVVSMIGEGNTDAGYKRIKTLIPTATAIKGKDGGQADTVKTHIDGKQPARVAHGEMYIPPAAVKRMGGAKKLYAMMDRVRAQATGSTKQIRPVSLKKAMA